MAAIAAVREGMTVFSADGKKLGKVIRRDRNTFIIEKGLFFKKDYVVGAEDVDGVEGDDITLRLTEDQLENDQAAQGLQSEREDEDDEALRAGTGRTEGQPSDAALTAAGDDEGDEVVFVEEEEIVTLVPDEDDRKRRR